MNQQRSYFGCVFNPTLQNIYVVGGHCEQEAIAHCEKFSISKNKWIEISPLSQKKANVALCKTDDNKYIYAIGGNNLANTYDDFEMYDIKLNKWRLIIVSPGKFQFTPRHSSFCQ